MFLAQRYQFPLSIHGSLIDARLLHPTRWYCNNGTSPKQSSLVPRMSAIESGSLKHAILLDLPRFGLWLSLQKLAIFIHRTPSCGLSMKSGTSRSRPAHLELIFPRGHGSTRISGIGPKCKPGNHHHRIDEEHLETKCPWSWALCKLSLS